MRLAVAATLVALLVGCRHPAREAQITDPGQGHTRGHGHGGGAPPVTMAIAEAGLPFQVLVARGGAQVDAATFGKTLAQADAICLGEEHPNPHHHWLQLELYRALSEAATAEGRELALGLEMVQRPFQGVLDDFTRGTIDQAALLGRVGWQDRWGYDFGFYGPTIAVATAAKQSVLALNAPGEITRTVAHQGLAGLAPGERAALPQLVLDDPAHRAWFQQATAGHQGQAAEAENFYIAQVIWDETMADTAARWLKAAPAGQKRQIVILAGTGHCMDAAIPQRLRRRGVASVISVRPVLDGGDSAVADALVAPEGDYLVVLDGKGGPKAP